MRILLVHNFYGSEAPSGENRVVEMEKRMLTARGHKVEVFFRESDVIRAQGLRGKIKGALITPWNWMAFFSIRKKIRSFRPDIVHVHNTFPLITPAIFWGIPRSIKTVLTLHNYRTMCPAAFPMREGKVCLRCIDKRNVWDALRFGCYRKSRLATFPLVVCVAMHRWLGTWNRVNVFIVLSEFQKEIFSRCGFEKSRIFVKGNFCDLQTHFDLDTPKQKSEVVVYVGRISAEKGIQTLVDAWRLLGENAPTLRIIGDGELLAEIRRTTLDIQKIEWIGKIPFAGVVDSIKQAKLLVLPSEWYETFGMVVVEAFALGVPVAVSDIGALPSIVKNGWTGVVFPPGDSQKLCKVIRRLWANQGKLSEMGLNAYKEYIAKYTEQANYQRLMEIYKGRST